MVRSSNDLLSGSMWKQGNEPVQYLALLTLNCGIDFAMIAFNFVVYTKTIKKGLKIFLNVCKTN